MVYTVNLKWLSFKTDLSDVVKMLNDEKATYVILRYAKDIPSWLYETAMDMLISVKSEIYYSKLSNLVKQYESASGIQMTMDEEIDSGLSLRINADGSVTVITNETLLNEIKSEKSFDIDDDDDADDDDITIIAI